MFAAIDEEEIRFNLTIKQCYLIVSSTETIQKWKSGSFKEKKRKNDTFMKLCSL